MAIIVDGNGRWAKQRGHERNYGHQADAETVHVIAEKPLNWESDTLLLYVSLPGTGDRPSDEVAALMGLLFDSIEEETFMKNNISFRVMGDVEKLHLPAYSNGSTRGAHLPQHGECAWYWH